MSLFHVITIITSDNQEFNVVYVNISEVYEQFGEPGVDFRIIT